MHSHLTVISPSNLDPWYTMIFLHGYWIPICVDMSMDQQLSIHGIICAIAWLLEVLHNCLLQATTRPWSMFTNATHADL